MDYEQNLDFNESISLEDSHDFAKEAGLDTHPDLKLIMPRLRGSRKLLELCAGYGRCLEFLLQEYSGEIHAVEWTDKYSDYLRNKYNGVKVYQQDVRYLDVDRDFDRIICMWGSILCFSENDQEKIIKGLHKNLTSSGLLILESPKGTLQATGEFEESRRVVLKFNGKTHNFHFSYEDDFRHMAEKAGFKDFEIQDYEISLGNREVNKRILYFLKK